MAFTPQPPKINGIPGSYKQPSNYGRNDSGRYFNFTFEGTNAEVDIDIGNLDAANAQYEVTELHGGRKRVVAKLAWPFTGTGNAEVPENVWELNPNDVEKELLEADFPFASAYTGSGTQLGDITNKTKEAISKWVSAGDAVWFFADTVHQVVSQNVFYGFADPSSNVDTPTQVTLLEADYAKAYSLYLILRAGVRTYPVDATVLRHVQTVSNTYAVAVSFLNVGRILSTSTLIATESVPTQLLFSVPSTPSASQKIETSGDLQYGWRKIRPNITRQNYTKWQITNNYQFGLWAVRLYGDVL